MTRKRVKGEATELGAIISDPEGCLGIAILGILGLIFILVLDIQGLI